MHGNTIITRSQEKEVATQRQTLRHAEDTEDKKAIFIGMVANLLYLSHQLKYIVGLINHTQALIKKTNGWSSCSND